MKLLFVPSCEPDQPELMISTERVLRCLGVSGKLIGFSYVIYMIDRIVEDPTALLLITKNLYPETAKIFGVSAFAIERATRTVINVCWKNETHDFLEYIAGKRLLSCPTNSEFLDMVAGYIRAMR